jgi:hypothetical protein
MSKSSELHAAIMATLAANRKMAEAIMAEFQRRGAPPATASPLQSVGMIPILERISVSEHELTKQYKQIKTWIAKVEELEIKVRVLEEKLEQQQKEG